MGAFTWRISDLLFENHLLRERIAALESGERFIRIQEEHRQEICLLFSFIYGPVNCNNAPEYSQGLQNCRNGP